MVAAAVGALVSVCAGPNVSAASPTATSPPAPASQHRNAGAKTGQGDVVRRRALTAVARNTMQYPRSGCDVGALGARRTHKSGDALFVGSAAAIAETFAPKPGGTVLSTVAHLESLQTAKNSWRLTRYKSALTASAASRDRGGPARQARGHLRKVSSRCSAGRARRPPRTGAQSRGHGAPRAHGAAWRFACLHSLLHRDSAAVAMARARQHALAELFELGNCFLRALPAQCANFITKRQ